MAPTMHTGTKTDNRAALPALCNSQLLGSLLSDADLLKVTVSKVLQSQLDVFFFALCQISFWWDELCYI